MAFTREGWRRMKIMTMGFVGDGWEEHDTDDERTCENCQYWDGHSDECRNPESEYYESTMHGEAGCDEWGGTQCN